MKFSTIGVAAAALIAMAGIAYAGDDHPQTSGIYVGLGGGYNSLEQDGVTLYTPNPSTALNGTPLDNATFKGGWDVFGTFGYKLEGGLRAEVELSHRENDGKYIVSSATPLSGKQKDTALMANLLYDIHTNSSLTPYFGLGVGVTTLDWKGVGTAGGPVFTDNSTKFAWQGIAGVSLALNSHWEALAEFHYKGSNGHSFADKSTGADIKDWDNHAREFLVGVRYFFGGPKQTEAAAAPPPPPPPAAAPTPPPAPPAEQKFLVFFDFDKSNLREDAKKIVTEAVNFAKSNNKTTIVATGHTDTSGTAAYNMGLSERRAKAVQAELERQGIPAREITVRWKGESDPLVNTGDGVKEPQNRRVEIVLE